MTVYIGWRGIMQILRDAGFTEDRTITLNNGVSATPLELAFCIVQGESGGDPWSSNTNTDSIKPAKDWFPGGFTHDCGLIQWNDYWWGADKSTVLYEPDAQQWYRDAFNPRVSAKWMYDHTQGGVRNWSTWLAFDNSSYLTHLTNARSAARMGAPDPWRPLVVGGKTPITAGSIAGRCNPGTRVSRWMGANKVVINHKGERIPVTSTSQLIYPGTTIRVPYWTTRIQAGPMLPDYAR